MTKGEETRARILSCTTALINRKGLKQTSMQDIIDETGVKKGNLYFHFQSKDALCLSLIRQAAEDYSEYLAKNIKSSDPREKIIDILNATLTYHRRKKFVGGCIFGNTALEMSDTDETYTELIQEVFDQWVRGFSGHLRAAIKAGLLSDEIKPDSMARHIAAAIEGSIMMARLYKREEPIVECIEYVKTLLGLPKR
jgi:TetR/AcrR family transcriptional repressor of nem operon